MSGQLPLAGDAMHAIDAETAAAASHGSYCPKLCNFACPVTAATGRDEAMPWSLHRTVDDLARGRRPPDDAAAHDLTYCTGCLACQVPCTFDQDVPAQVRAGRAAVASAGSAPPAVGAARAARGAGASPFGVDRVDVADEAPAAAVALLVGCRDDAAVVEAARTLLRAGGVEAHAVLPDGCCGATLRDLGAVPDADVAAATLGDRLAAHDRVLAVDPHCLPELRALGLDARHVLAEVAELTNAGRLTFDGRVGPVTYHDPCLLARQERLVQEPRTLLAAAGAEVVEPEHHATTTACSGAGLGLELLDVDAAETTAARRRTELRAAGAPTTVTACSGARARLATDDEPVHDLLQLLASHLTDA